MEKHVIDHGHPTKVYRIERDEKTGTVIIHVGVKWPAGFSWRFLSHCNLHSPTGFEVGYAGSGPADTAASILADYFEEDSRSVKRAWRGRSNGNPSIAIKLHQFFKFDMIAGIRLEPGEVHILEHFSTWYIPSSGSHDERFSRRGTFSTRTTDPRPIETAN